MIKVVQWEPTPGNVFENRTCTTCEKGIYNPKVELGPEIKLFQVQFRRDWLVQVGVVICEKCLRELEEEVSKCNAES